MLDPRKSKTLLHNVVHEILANLWWTTQFLVVLSLFPITVLGEDFSLLLPTSRMMVYHSCEGHFHQPRVHTNYCRYCSGRNPWTGDLHECGRRMSTQQYLHQMVNYISYSYRYEMNKRVIPVPMKYFPWEAIHWSMMATPPSLWRNSSSSVGANHTRSPTNNFSLCFSEQENKKCMSWSYPRFVSHKRSGIIKHGLSEQKRIHVMIYCNKNRSIYGET